MFMLLVPSLTADHCVLLRNDEPRQGEIIRQAKAETARHYCYPRALHRSININYKILRMLLSLI